MRFLTVRFLAVTVFARASSRVSLCLAAAALSLGGCGGDAEHDDAPPTLAAQAPKQPVVALRRGRLTVDGQNVALPGPVAAWEAALGAPSRQEALAASATEPAVHVYIWDDRGVVAVERPDVAQVTKVSLVWEASRSSSASSSTSDGDNAPLTPASAFPGSLSIEGVHVAADTTPVKLNAALEPSRFERLKTFPHSWNMAYGTWTITAITDIQGQRLVEISIGD